MLGVTREGYLKWSCVDAEPVNVSLCSGSGDACVSSSLLLLGLRMSQLHPSPVGPEAGPAPAAAPE